MKLPRALLVHTAGAAWADAVAMPADGGPRLAVARRPDLELGRVARALDRAGVAGQVDGEAVGRYPVHLVPPDGAFAGESADLAVAVAVVLAWLRLGLERLAADADPDAIALDPARRAARPLAPDDPERPAWCASGRLRADGAVEPVVGWTEKLAAAARFAPGRPLRVFCAPEDVAAVRLAARDAGVDATAEPVENALELAHRAADTLGLAPALAARLRARLRLPVPWRPEGWPPVAPGLALALAEARALAGADGYVGLEHLVAALDRLPDEGALAELRRTATWRALRTASESPWRVVPEAGPMRATPRLAALGARLATGADLATLAAALRDDPRAGFRPLTLPELVLAWAPETAGAPVQLPVDRTATTADIPAPRAMLRLLVVGGPEDGRELRVEVGQTLGRAADPRPDVGLYDGTPVFDATLSRQHARWTAQGLVPLRALVVRRGAARHTPATGEPMPLCVGDELRLTERTLLRVLPS